MPQLEDDLGILDGGIELVSDPNAMAQTKKFEGYRPTIYTDTVGKRTIGNGFNIDDPAVASILPPDVVSGKRPIEKPESDKAFEVLYPRAQRDAYNIIGPDTYLNLPPQISDIVNDMSYNLGASKFAGFHKAIGALQEGDWKEFGEQIKDSKWYHQVGNRSKTHYQTIQNLIKPQSKVNAGDVLSSLNPFAATDANASERVNIEGIDMEDDLGIASPPAQPAVQSADRINIDGVDMEDDLGILQSPAPAKAQSLSDLLNYDAKSALRPLSPENAESIKAGVYGAGEIALSRTDLYKDPEVKKLLEEHPLAKGIGETARDLALLVPIGRVLEGVAAAPFIAPLAQGIAKLAEGTSIGRRFLNPLEATRYVAKAVHSGASFGTLAAIKEAGIESPDQNVASIAKNVAENSLWGAGLGLTTAAPHYLARVAMAGSYGGVTTALSGGSPQDIALNSALFGGFELIGGPGVDRKIKLSAMGNMRSATSEYLQKGGMSPDEAVRTADTAMNNSVKAAGGMDQVLDNNSAPFMNQLASEMSKVSPTWEITRPKTLPDNTPFETAKAAPETPPAGQEPVGRQETQPQTGESAFSGQSKEVPGNAYSLNSEDAKDIKDLIEWEHVQPNGERVTFIDDAGIRQFVGVPSGHSKTMQDLGPKAALELLQKASSGQELTLVQEAKVRDLLKDYRTNLKAKQTAAGQDSKSGIRTFKNHEDLNKYVDEVYAKGGDIVSVGPDPMDEEGYQVEVNFPEGAKFKTDEPFYSQAAKVVDEKMPNAASVEQVRGILSDKNGVKAEELQWMGLDDFLAGKTKVTKAELQEFIKNNQVQVKEVEKGDAKIDAKTEELAKERVAAIQVLNRIADNIGGGTPYQSGQPIRWMFKDVENKPTDVPEKYIQELDAAQEKITAYDDHVQETGDEFFTKKETKFGQYQLPGGKNYRELLLTLPANRKDLSFDEFKAQYRKRFPDADSNDALLLDFYNKGVIVPATGRLTAKMAPDIFKSSHFDEQNILAHVRMNDRTDAEGKKVLFVEEVQSDWHQKGKKQGYKGEHDIGQEIVRAIEKAEGANDQEAAMLLKRLQILYADGDSSITRGHNSTQDIINGLNHARQMGGGKQRIPDGDTIQNKSSESVDRAREYLGGLDRLRGISNAVPAAPFKKSWQELAMKRMLRYAAEHGYDKLAWTTGEQQAERYDLSKHVDAVQWTTWPSAGKDYGVLVASQGAKTVLKETIPESKIEDYVGKEVAKKLMESTPDAHGRRLLDGENLKVGGEGMKGFYDQILPSFMNKYAKKWGARVGKSVIEHKEEVFNADYEGPTYTRQQLQDAKKVADKYGPDIFESPFTGEKQRFAVNRVSISGGLRDMIDEMASGMTFNEAMQVHGSIELADLFGGKIKHDKKKEVVSKDVHSVEITPLMRSRVMEGQPLFKEQPSWDDLRADKKNVEEANAAGLDLIKKYVPQLADSFVNVPYLTTPEGKRALGMYFNGKISVVSGVRPEVYIHEIGHAVFDMFLTPDERAELLKEAGGENAEEKIMNDFERYWRQKESGGGAEPNLGQKIKSLFDRMIERLKKFFKAERSKVKAFYDAILRGEYKNKPAAKEAGKDVKYKGMSKDEVNKRVEEIKKGKERRFIKTVREAPNTTKQVAKAVEGTYEPISNAITLDEAKALYTKDPDAAMEMLMKNGPLSRVEAGLAGYVLNKMMVEKKNLDAKMLAEHIARRGTESGQGVQALYIYERLSPEGVLLMATRAIKQAQEQLPADKIKQFKDQSKGLGPEDIEKLAKRMGVPFLPADTLEEIRKMAEEIQAMPDGRKKHIKTALMLQKIADHIPPSLWSKVSMAQTLAQLLNTKTFVRNLLGNLGFQGIENVSDTIGTAIDIVTALKTGERTVGVPDVVTQGKGAVQGFKEGVEETMLGIDLKGNASKFQLPKGTVYKHPLLKKLEQGLRVSLGATDRAFYQAAVNESLRQQMRFAGASTPTEEMMERAHSLGLYRTFQDDSLLARQFVRLKRWFNFGKEWGLGDMILKYPKTPANILARGIEYSPFGLMKTIYKISQPLMGRQFDQEGFVRATSRALTGSTLLVGVGAILAALGIISGRRTKDKDLQSTRENVGIREYQINVSALKRFVMSGMDAASAQMRPGDQLLSYDWFQPQAIGVALGANMVIDPNKNVVDAVRNLGERTMQASETIQEQPLIQGVETFMRTGSAAQGVVDTVQNIPASFMPTVINQVRQLVDNTARTTKDPDYWKEMGNKVLMRTPGLSSRLPARITSLGFEKEMYQGDTNSVFNVLFNPAFASRYKPDPVSAMVLDIWEHSGERIQFPRVAALKVKMPGSKEEVELDPETYMEYQKYIGEKTRVAFTRLASDSRFMALSDEVKAKALQRTMSDIASDAKRNILGRK